MQKAPFVFPIVGGRKVEHLHANLEALDISISPEQIKFLEDVLPFDFGFPHNMLVSARRRYFIAARSDFLSITGRIWRLSNVLEDVCYTRRRSAPTTHSSELISWFCLPSSRMYISTISM